MFLRGRAWDPNAHYVGGAFLLKQISKANNIVHSIITNNINYNSFSKISTKKINK